MSYSVFDANILRDLVTLSFDFFILGRRSHVWYHMINTFTKFENPTPIRSRVRS